MCWSKNVSLAMTIIGLFSTYYSYKYIDKYWSLYAFYLVLMQLIHYFAYIVIDDCDNFYNKALAYINYTHVAFQPFMYLLGHYGLFRRYDIINKSQLNIYRYLIIFSLIPCILFFLRIFPIKYGDHKYDLLYKGCAYCGKICSFSGKKHVDFKLPLRRKPEYFTPSIFFHFMFFFIPYLFFNKTTIIFTTMMFITAAIPSILYNTSASEAGTLWCGIAVLQWLMTFLYINNYNKLKFF
tara:strand:- start:204 stop:917 length:714 start_codon:yes stop_codon:yes gene_type:complete